MKPAASVASALALVLLSACPQTETRAFCEQFAAQQCGFAYGCCSGVEIDQIIGGGPAHTTEAECVDEFTRLFCQATSGFEDAEREGRAEFNRDGVQPCLDALSAARSSCDAEAFVEARQVGGDCALNINDLITPLVDDGDACFGDFECKDGGTCEIEDNEDPDEFVITAQGSCTTPPGEGDECPDFVCQPGLTCSNDVCEPFAGVGEDCFDTQCDEGLFCDFNQGVCRAQVDRGDDCPQGNECQENDQCIGGVCEGPPRVVVEICEVP